MKNNKITKLLPLIFGLTIVGCGKIDNPVNPEPIDENISLTDFKNGLSKIESNFKGEIKESLIDDSTSGFDEIRTASASFDKASNGDYHFHRNSFDYHGELDLDKFRLFCAYIEGLEPDDPKIDEILEGSMNPDIYLNDLYQHIFKDEESVREGNIIKYDMDVMNYLGRTIDRSNFSFEYLLDYLDYYKFRDGPLSHEYFKGKKKTKRDWREDGDEIGNDLFYFVYDLKDQVENAIYDENTKTYTFSNDFLINYADFESQYDFFFRGSSLANGFNTNELTELEIKFEFNTSKTISKFVLTAKSHYDTDFPFDTNYILEFDYLGELNSNIELSDYKETCDHKYISYDINSECHYSYCSNDETNCRKVINYEPHSYDENGVCTGCGFMPKDYFDVATNEYPTDGCLFYYQKSTVTGKATYYSSWDYNEIEWINLKDSLVKDFDFGEYDDITIAAEKDYANKDSYYMLVHAYVETITNCLYKEDTYSYMYHVENNVPILIGTGVDYYEEETHDYEIVEGSLLRIDDETCHAKFKCSDCGDTFEEDCYVYLERDYDYDEKRDCSYLYISCCKMIRPFETENHYFYYHDIVYDENGFETITHTHFERENIGTEAIGVDSFTAFYYEDGSLDFVNYKGNYHREDLENGFKLVFTSYGDNSVELYRFDTDTKDKDTCLLHKYTTYRLVINGVTVFEKTTADQYRNLGEAAAEHNFAYVEGSLEYNPYFEEYAFKVKCLDCGKEFLVDDAVSIFANYGEKTHDLHGYYHCFDAYGEETYAEATVTCECEPSEKDENFCKWCDGFIGELE